jgi:hypothetical protein
MIYVKARYKGKSLNLLFDDNADLYSQLQKAVSKIKRFKAKKLEIIEKVEIVNEAIDLLYLFSKTPITPALAIVEVVSDMAKEIEDTFD